MPAQPPDQPIPDASDADRQEQEQEVVAGSTGAPAAVAPATADPEAPDADAQEQAEVVPDHDEERLIDDDDRPS